MIDLQKYKAQRLKHFSQVILLDNRGMIVQSCDSIFSTTQLSALPVYKWLPFLESIFESLLKLKVGEPELLFSKVEEPFESLPGYYDFSFSRIENNNQTFILWSIYDYTVLYQDLKHHQQLRNELEIKRQRAVELSNLLSSKFKLAPKELDVITAEINGHVQEKSLVLLYDIIEEVVKTFDNRTQFEFKKLLIPENIVTSQAIFLKLALFQLIKQTLAFFKTCSINIELQKTGLATNYLKITEQGIPYNIELLDNLLSQKTNSIHPFQLWHQPVFSDLYIIKKVLELLNGDLLLRRINDNKIEIVLTFEFSK